MRIHVYNQPWQLLLEEFLGRLLSRPDGLYTEIPVLQDRLETNSLRTWCFPAGMRCAIYCMPQVPILREIRVATSMGANVIGQIIGDESRVIVRSSCGDTLGLVGVSC